MAMHIFLSNIPGEVYGILESLEEFSKKKLWRNFWKKKYLEASMQDVRIEYQEKYRKKSEENFLKAMPRGFSKCIHAANFQESSSKEVLWEISGGVPRGKS